MSQPIVYIDTSKIREGKIDELERSIEKLVDFVEENMPRLISYSFFFNKDRTQMTVTAIHPDSESIEYHMDKGKEEFKKFSDLLDLLSIEIYGEISDSVLERLHQKAQMLGNASVTVHDFIGGFNRKEIGQPS